jgi:uncharacterized protein (TIGR02145 family)
MKRNVNLILVMITVFMPLGVFNCKKQEIPTVITGVVRDITATSATCEGTVTDDGGAKIKARGVCWGVNDDPTTSDSKTIENSSSDQFLSSIGGLQPGTVYHVRAYATNSTGTAYGLDISFTTIMEDVNGNVYTIITIGMQSWLGENLKVTNYNDGIEITEVADNTEWENSVSGSYCWYDNNSGSDKTTYGALYNWYAVNSEKLCPEGWHVPSFSEWLDLMTFIGGGNESYGRQIGGALLKESGTTHWDDPNYATDQYGFKALPGGLRSADGLFLSVKSNGHWWASRLWWAGGDNGTDFIMLNDSEGVSYGSVAKNNGLSIRCLKDN